MTLVVSLLGGPGVGKSTLAAEMFVALKKKGVRVELVTEYAKDCTYEERSTALSNQVYVFGKQHHRMYRLLGKVDVIITDSPILLSLVYRDLSLPASFNRAVIDIFKQFNNVVFLLNREVEYQDYGRGGTVEDAIAIDNAIKEMLEEYNIGYLPISVKNSVESCIRYIEALCT